VVNVCAFYGIIGFLIRCKYLPKRQFLEKEGGALLRCYAIAQVQIEQRREEADWPELSSNFEWIARQAYKHRTRRQWTETRRWRRLVRDTAGLSEMSSAQLELLRVPPASRPARAPSVSEADDPSCETR
jgi:hypothetical protein